MDFNFATIQFLSENLNIEISEAQTQTYQEHYDDLLDGRSLVNAKKPLVFKQDSYFQVFDDRNDFITNTSGLDLLFNEGTNAHDYLEKQNAPLPHA